MTSTVEETTTHLFEEFDIPCELGFHARTPGDEPAKWACWHTPCCAYWENHGPVLACDPCVKAMLHMGSVIVCTHCGEEFDPARRSLAKMEPLHP